MVVQWRPGAEINFPWLQWGDTRLLVFINAAITSWTTGQDNLQSQVTSKHFILLLVGPVSDFE